MVIAINLATSRYKAQVEEWTTCSRCYSLIVASGDWLKDTWLNCALL